MTCEACLKRREWLKKWVGISYERAKTIFGVTDTAARPSDDADTSTTGIYSGAEFTGGSDTGANSSDEGTGTEQQDTGESDA